MGVEGDVWGLRETYGGRGRRMGVEGEVWR